MHLWPYRVLTSGAVAYLGAFLISAPSSAQPVTTPDTLATHLNVGDRVRVQDSTDRRVTGRLTDLTQHRLVVRSETREVVLDTATLRSVAVASHPFRRSLLVGAAAFAALGATATCAREGGADCVVVGGVRTVPVGLGVGLAAGALLTRMREVYHRQETGSTAPAAFDGESLLDDLGRRVNVGDRLRIADQAGVTRTGVVMHFGHDAVTLRTRDGAHRYTRESLGRVTLRKRPVRAAVLIGTAAGVGTGAVLACTGADRSECVDGPLLLGALGAVVGFGVGSMVDRSLLVFPESVRRATVEPLLTRRGAGLSVTRRW